MYKSMKVVLVVDRVDSKFNRATKYKAPAKL